MCLRYLILNRSALLSSIFSNLQVIGGSLLAIERYLPHRKPVLMLTRVVSETETSLEAEAFLDVDFPFQNAAGVVFDAVWCEMAAQAAAVFMGRNRGSGGIGFLTGIDDFEIVNTVRIPARVVAGVRVTRQLGRIFTFAVEILGPDASCLARGGLSFFVENPGGTSEE
ncbi:MAG: hypothetical protein HY788_14700 [Deltaproteobacteria bacterium]|nr:hypothetical protein [Deltaproteobacteria bacterium]